MTRRTQRALILAFTALFFAAPAGAEPPQVKPNEEPQELIPLFDESQIAKEEAIEIKEGTISGLETDDASTSLLDISWRGAYTPMPEDILLELKRKKGLSSRSVRALMKPSTANAIRVTILDEAIRHEGGDAKKVADQLIRAITTMRGEDALTLDRLSETDLLMLGYLAARASPDKLDALGGDSEVERLSPMVLLTAASSRRRGDLTTRLVLAQVKAHHATIAPEEALCTPRECIADAVRPFYEEWSVQPELVCSMVKVAERGDEVLIRDSDDPIAFCSKPGLAAPTFVEQADQEEQERKAALQQAAPSIRNGPATGTTTTQVMPPGMSGMLGGGHQVSKQMLTEQLAMLDFALAELDRELRQMNGPEAMLFEQMARELKAQRDVLEQQISAMP